ncbi:MAG: SPOR domain-containing protein [Pikeienuella sp.]
MTRHTAAQGHILKRLALGLATAGGLSACAELAAHNASSVGAAGPQVSQAAAADAIEPGPTALIDARLQPVPEEFEIDDTAAWDGQRTLQGIWVAHPAAETARRVRILNTDNGYVVDGALFRRDGSGSGPAILVSSDAAAALGMTPEREVTLSIVAIRRAPVRPSLAAEAALQPQAGAVATAPAEPEERETAAAEPSEEVAAEAEPAEAIPAERVPTPAPTEPSAGPDRVALAPPEPAQRPTEAPLPQPEPSTEADAPASGDSTVAGLRRAPGDEETAGFVEDWPLVRQPPAAGQALSGSQVAPQSPPRAPEPANRPGEPAPAAQVARGQPRPEPEEQPSAPEAEPETAQPEPTPEAEAVTTLARAEPAQADTVEATPDPEPTAPESQEETPASPLDRPFIQAGLFGVESNAERLVRLLQDAGFTAEGLRETYGGRELTRVRAGPFMTAAERDRALREIRRIGPNDALPVAR